MKPCCNGRGLAGDFTAQLGDALAGQAAALRQLWQLTYREALTMTFADAFLAVGCCFVIATLMVPLMRKVAPPKAASADAH
jgi:DHA2 family multidrug resistance protein